MAEKYLVGIDVGTTGAKTIIFNLKGEIVGSGYREYACCYPKPNWVEQDANELIAAVFETNKAALKDAGIHPADVLSVAASTQRGCCVFVDKQDVPMLMISWQDNRTTDEVDEISRKIGDARYYQITGMPNAPTWLLPKILYVRSKMPGIWERTHKHVQLQDVILKALGADGYYTDESAVALTGLWDTDGFCYSDEMMSAFDIDKEKMAEVCRPGTQVGRITGDAAQKSGFKEGTPVCVGIGDQSSATVGAGVVYPGMLSVSLGTGGMAVAFLDKKYRDPKGKTIVCNHALHGNWQLEGLQNGSAGVYRWFRDEVAALEYDRCRREGCDVYEVLNEKIREVPVLSNGLLCMPFFAGAASPRWNVDARGMFFGLTLSHTRADMARACMEGIILEQKDIIQNFKDNGVSVSKVRIIGGPTKSEIWNQIQADVYDVPAETLKVKDAAVLGAALAGAVGVGLYEDVRAAADDLVKPGKRYEPIPKNAAKYREMYGIYCDIFESMSQNDVYKRISDLQK